MLSCNTGRQRFGIRRPFRKPGATPGLSYRTGEIRRSVLRDDRAAEFVVQADAANMFVKLVERIAQNSSGKGAYGTTHVELCEQIFGLDGPVTTQLSFRSSTNGPSGLYLRNRRVLRVWRLRENLIELEIG